jgi:hypothetical protein
VLLAPRDHAALISPIQLETWLQSEAGGLSTGTPAGDAKDFVF